jgi:hypothetical protein
VRKNAIVILVLVALGLVARAEEKVQKETGSARARFAWEKWDGRFADELPSLTRLIEGAGTGAIEVDSGNAAVWVNYDPDKTTAKTLLEKLKGAGRYEKAALTSVVACFDAPFVTVRATAGFHGAKPPQKGVLAVTVEATEGHTVLLAEPKKRSGKFQPGITTKAPAEVVLDKTSKTDPGAHVQSYTHHFTTKKGAEDSTIAVTINVVEKTKDKETLHSIELSVPVLGN